MYAADLDRHRPCIARLIAKGTDTKTDKRRKTRMGDSKSSTNSYATILLAFVYALSLQFTVACSQTPSEKEDSSRIRLTIDTSEAEAVLAILSLKRDGKPITEEQWKKLFATEPYERLKNREAYIANHFHNSSLIFTDQNFRDFVLSDSLLKLAPELRSTLVHWQEANLQTAARKVLGYLPDSATIRAKVFPVIKPRTNSFVWESSTNPAIFLYIDPEVTGNKFANTVAHELHHIGLASVNAQYEKMISPLPEKARTVAERMSSFGEGMAMLAAAGSPDLHPHEMSTMKDRARWDHDMSNFGGNLRSVDTFFVDILSGKLADQDSIETKGSSFYGIQGPWYTVGYTMCVVVEKRFGRGALISTMTDPRRLLLLYNQATKEENDRGIFKRPLWTEHVLEQVGAK